MKIKIYQTEWYGIKFETFAKLSSKKIADPIFYQKFYDVFFKTFNSFESLPQDIKNTKGNVAEIVFETFKEQKKILSIGCGNCLVEHFLLKRFQDEIRICGIDPGNSYRKWVDDRRFNYINGFFPQDIDNVSEFDCCYLSTIDYAMSDKDYFKFLQSLHESGIKNFLLTDLPGNSDIVFYKKFIKAKILSVYNFFCMKNSGQFWGFLRPLSMHKKMLHNIGFKNIQVGYLKHGSAWITAEA